MSTTTGLLWLYVALAFATALALAFSLGIWMFRPWFTGMLIGLVLRGVAAHWPAVAAGTTIFVIPILLFTILLRKQLLRGITFGAVRK